RCEDIDNHADTLADESLEARPAKTVEMNEASAQMRELIAALPDRQRQTLFMYYYADMSYEEIAEALGTTVGTVGTNVMKAKRNLKKTMERTNSFTEDTREPTKALGGMAMGSAILSAFEAEVDATVTASQVDAVLKACGARIADLSVAGSSSATVGQVAAKTGIGGIKLAIIAVAAVVGTAAIVASNIPRDTETEAPAVAAVAEESEPYLPAAEIELAGLEGLPSKINPSGATLIAEDGEPVLWRIVDGNDALLASGTGREIDEAVFELSPGVYAVEWIIENDAGERAVARREIEIVEDPTQFARFTDSETEEAPLADSDPDAKSFADF
ncbi:MAG: sigma-70 family RNA polymerase sigma factor, partial [Clostridiales Family XIII bacterium]|nr:sigma-70 family RNA polymerase sigma factor [Clostridiales Family XIII bacterium]